jgi:hypothetical protein
VLLSVLAAAIFSAATPATVELRTERFKIVHTERAADAAKVLANELERRRDEVREVLGRDWGGVTEVRLGWGRAEFEALALAEEPVPSWAVALAWPEHNVMLIEAQSLAKNDGQETLRHELVHIALGRLGHGWPRWFQEASPSTSPASAASRWSTTPRSRAPSPPIASSASTICATASPCGRSTWRSPTPRALPSSPS